VLLLVGQGPTEAATSFGEVWLVSYACAVILTNQFHKWAHASRVPWGVRRLQAWRIVVSPSHHARHHEGRGAHAYCVTTGWLNPMLDGLGVFASLTRAIRGVAARARQVAL
jgi:ubiquitin-conjugating enzyme E2 variant